MRTLLGLLLLLPTGACGPGSRRPSAPIAPQGLAVDSGALVRVRLNSGDTITGHLLAPFTPTSSELLVCCAREQALCATLDAPSVRHVPVTDLRAVAVRGRLAGNLGLLGLYLGGLTGAIAHRDKSGGSMGLGMVAGVTLGTMLGSHVTGWVPLFPCSPHGQCEWRGTWPARAPPER